MKKILAAACTSEAGCGEMRLTVGTVFWCRLASMGKASGTNLRLHSTIRVSEPCMRNPVLQLIYV